MQSMQKAVGLHVREQRGDEVGEGHELRNRELFGTHREKPHPRLFPCREGSIGGEGGLQGSDGIGTEELAQGDAQHLATLVEDGLHDAAEELFVAA